MAFGMSPFPLQFGTRGGGSSWTPEALPTAVAWYDFLDAGTLFTDTAGTTPADISDDVARADSELIGSYPLLQASDTVRPVRSADGLAFTSGDYLVTSATLPFSGRDIWIAFVATKTDNGDGRAVAGFNDGTANYFAVNRSSTVLRSAIGSGSAERRGDVYASPFKNRLFAQISRDNLLSTEITTIENGAVVDAVTTGSAQNTDFSSAVLYVGRRTEGVWPMVGSISQLIVGVGELSVGERTSLVNWMAGY